MDEYIERRKIYAAVSELLCDDGDHILSSFECGNDFAISGALDIIGKAPAADVRPEIHSKWGVYQNYLICMRCSFSYEIKGKVYNLCPDCGAKMDGKDGKSD